MFTFFVMFLNTHDFIYFNAVSMKELQVVKKPEKAWKSYGSPPKKIYR